ncbi:cuticle development [Branchiostoma belcheri]|nr:cuticle development [Branchiostoma belcheri]
MALKIIPDVPAYYHVSASFTASGGTTSAFGRDTLGGGHQQAAAGGPHVEMPLCDGWYNNAAHPDYGSTGMPLSRDLPPAYSDDAYRPSGPDRPNPRLVSQALVKHLANTATDTGRTVLCVFFGQHVVDDIADVRSIACPAEYSNIALQPGDPLHSSAESDSTEKIMPFQRAVYRAGTGTSANNPRQQVNAATSWLDGSAIYGVSEAWQDRLRSFVNGSLRASHGGKLPDTNVMGLPMQNLPSPNRGLIELGPAADRLNRPPVLGGFRQGDLNPLVRGKIPTEQVNFKTISAVRCADAPSDGHVHLAALGNVRGNENPFLLAVSTAWNRWHNHWAHRIHTQHPDWTDDQVFQQAKRWVVATYQRSTTRLLVPPPSVSRPNADVVPPEATQIAMRENRFETTSRSGLGSRRFQCDLERSDGATWNRLRGGWVRGAPAGQRKQPAATIGAKQTLAGPSNRYNRFVDPSPSNVFTAAAMRYGHSMVPSAVFKRNSSGDAMAIRTCNTYWNVEDVIQTAEDVDGLLSGMAGQIADGGRNIVSEDLQGFLYGPLTFSRRDLVAMDIQRGRDHGLPDYNTACREYGIPPLRNWTDIKVVNPKLTDEMLSDLSTLYGSVDRLDVWVGGMLAGAGAGAPGQLYRTIIKQQFLRLRDADRFWFENSQTRRVSHERRAALTLPFNDLLITHSPWLAYGITPILRSLMNPAGQTPGFSDDELNTIRGIKFKDILSHVTDVPSAQLQDDVFFWKNGESSTSAARTAPARNPDSHRFCWAFDGNGSPLEVDPADLEPCTGRTTFSYFDNVDWVTFGVTVIVLCLFPLEVNDLLAGAPSQRISAECRRGPARGGCVFVIMVAAWRNELRTERRMQTPKKKLDLPPSAYQATEWQGRRVPTRQVVVKLQSPSLIEVRDTRDTVVRLVNIAKIARGIILVSTDRGCKFLSIHIPREYDLATSGTFFLKTWGRSGIDARHSHGFARCKSVFCMPRLAVSGFRTEAVLTTHGCPAFAHVFARRQHAEARTAGCARSFMQVLKFSSHHERETFLSDLKQFLATQQVPVELQEVELGQLQKQAVTIEDRQKTLEDFFCSVFLQALSSSRAIDDWVVQPEKWKAKNALDCELTKVSSRTVLVLTNCGGVAEAMSLRPDSQFVVQMFDLVDKDKNGYISFREFLDLVVIFSKGTMEDKLRVMFDMYDLEGNGYLSRDELSNMLGSLMELVSNNTTGRIEDLVESMFAEAGMDGEQDMSFDKFVSMMQDHKEELNQARLNIAGSDWTTLRPTRTSAPKETGRRRSSSVLPKGPWRLRRASAPVVSSSDVVSAARRKTSPKLDPINSVPDTDMADGDNVISSDAATVPNGKRRSTGRSSSDIKVNLLREAYPTTAYQRKMQAFKRWVENKRLQILYLIFYFFITFALFAERAYHYAVEAEDFGIRQLTQYGIIASRGAAASMSFSFSLLLLTMCRNSLTKLRETFLNRYIPFDYAVDFHKIVAITALVFTILHTLGHLVNVYHFAVHPLNHLVCLFPSLRGFDNGYVLVSYGHNPPHVLLRAVYVQKHVACRPHSYTLRNRASDVRVTCVDATPSPHLTNHRSGTGGHFKQWQLPGQCEPPAGPATGKLRSFQSSPDSSSVTGVLLLLVVSIIYVFATGYARRRAFSAFWATHQLYIVLFILTVLHGSGRLIQNPNFHLYLVGPAIIFTLDKLVSISHRRQLVDIVKTELLPSDVTNIQFKRPDDFEYKSGQWVRIACPEQGPNEYHPMTLTSAPHESTLSVHVRAVGPWTAQLRRTYDPENLSTGTQKIFLDGPFGEGHQDWYKYKVAVLVGGGIGITPFASILKDVAYLSSTGANMNCKKVYFLWVTRTQRHFEWFIDIIREVEEQDRRGLVAVHIFITQFFEKFDVRTTMLYIYERHFQRLSGRSLFTGLRATTHFGRPEFVSLLDSIQHQNPEVKKIGVFSCGPPA